MLEYLSRRIALMVPTLLGVAILTFVIMRIMPGDVALLIVAGEGGYADPSQVEKVRRELGLDKPLLVQFATWLWGVLRFDFGTSLWTTRPVLYEIGVRLPLSLQIAVMATLVAAALAIPLGSLAAMRQDSWVDYGVRVFTIAGLAIPSFWLGILMLLAMVLWFHWSPPMIYTPFFENPAENLKQTIWPALAVGYRYSAIAARMMRSSLLEVLREDYIRTAWAKGLRERVIIIRHGLRNALLPVITILGYEFAFLIGGLVVTETVFNLNGVGRLVVEAVFHRDYNIIQALVLLIALGFVVVNLIVDVFYAFLDPRIRYH
ncbi:MAG: ABC transporter permease [Dehalococcoidia bacterium]|nr:ABC transporter permease [Dehalococcoidia bacterium]MDW8119764.1 ABC transporter permease [Chloroflexota bacterium]